jgi:hypothetical protein
MAELKTKQNNESVGCFYINKLEDIDLEILSKLIKLSVMEMQRKHDIIE